MEETKTEQKPIGETENENINTGQKYMPEEKESGKYYAAFTKPYIFEGKEYNGVDLEGIQNLTTKKKIEIDRMYNSIETEKPRIPTISTMYVVCVAVKITKFPIEFFYNLRNAEFRTIEAVVSKGFFTPD